MSDTELGPLEQPAPVPNTYNPVVNVSGLLPGMAVAASATPNVVHAADAAAVATAYATGLLLPQAPTTAGQRSNARYSGVLALTAAQWAAATVEAAVLTPGVPYFTSSGHPGKITKTAPSGEGDTPEQVGVALSPLSIMVQIAGEGIVGPQGPAGPTAVPVTQYLDGPGANPFVAVADPEADVTFIGYGTAFAHAGNVTLANGTVDGFRKTFLVGGLNDGAITITPASWGGPGTHLAIGAGTVGAATLVWSETETLWNVESLYVIATA